MNFDVVSADSSFFFEANPVRLTKVIVVLYISSKSNLMRLLCFDLSFLKSEIKIDTILLSDAIHIFFGRNYISFSIRAYQQWYIN